MGPGARDVRDKRVLMIGMFTERNAERLAQPGRVAVGAHHQPCAKRASIRQTQRHGVALRFERDGCRSRDELDAGYCGGALPEQAADEVALGYGTELSHALLRGVERDRGSALRLAVVVPDDHAPVRTNSGRG